MAAGEMIRSVSLPPVPGGTADTLLARVMTTETSWTNKGRGKGIPVTPRWLPSTTREHHGSPTPGVECEAAPFAHRCRHPDVPN
jgi:hypothetical protein